jgi:hypothetical protein
VEVERSVDVAHRLEAVGQVSIERHGSIRSSRSEQTSTPELRETRDPLPSGQTGRRGVDIWSTLDPMEFFVPHIDGEGHMSPDDAEAAWQACRKGAEGDMGHEALARRVYRLDYRHNGRELTAVVGEREKYYDHELVMAIIAFPGVYKICCEIRGYIKVGDTPMAGEGSVREFVDFDPPTLDD